jgi:hypothetical protein
MRSHCRTLLAFTVGALIALAPSLARAQAFELLRLEVQKRSSAEKKSKKKGPKKLSHKIHAVIKTEMGNLSADKFSLTTETKDGPVSVKGERAVPYSKSDDPLALVILVQGDERWMGNETYVENPDDSSPGAFTGVGPAIDALAKSGPPGSKATLMVYRAGKPETKFDGPLSELAGTSLGQQKDYEGIGVPLIPGLAEAANKLAAMGSYRKVLVVMGDGTGQVDNVAPQLKGPVKKLKSIGAESYTIFFQAIPTPDTTGYAVMKKIGYTSVQKATSKDNFGAFSETIAKKIGARYYIDFPVRGLPTDGQVHEMIFKFDKEEAEPKEIKLPDIGQGGGGGGSLWWLWWIVLPLILIVALVIWLAKREPKAAPQPVFEPEPEPEAPVGSPKTVMLNVGGQEGGMPIVGWVVPLTGPNQYQTFKLLQGPTKLGTGGDAHIVVDDTFMSTVHAEIVCTPAGFTLNDAGSTNGTFVNQKRVSQHELVDNDVFTLGKTDFKFKSIN